MANQLVPEMPIEVAKVYYPNGVEVSNGRVLQPIQIITPPTIKWNADPDAFYTICITDPDAPSRSDPLPQWHHWLVVNIPGNNIEKGEVVTSYMGWGPSVDGVHRYEVLIFKQKRKQSFIDLSLKWSGDSRNNLRIDTFVEKYDLESLVATNFFEADWKRD